MHGRTACAVFEVESFSSVPRDVRRYPTEMPNFTLRQYRLRSVLIATAIVAFTLAWLSPFTPSLTLSAPTEVDPQPYWADRYREYEIDVTNSGRFPVWLSSIANPVPCLSWEFDAKHHDATLVSIDIWKNDCTKLSPGATRTFVLAVKRDFDAFNLSLEAKDWRGRSAWYNAGEFRPALLRPPHGG